MMHRNSNTELNMLPNVNKYYKSAICKDAQLFLNTKTHQKRGNSIT